MEILLRRLGYRVELEGIGDARKAVTAAPEGRRVVFVGDLVDRGPRSPDVLRIVMAMVAAGQGLCVPGNHDVKFVRWLSGRNVHLTHGLDRTVAQFEPESAVFKHEVKTFLEGLASYLWLDDGRLAVAHAGIKEESWADHRVTFASSALRRYGGRAGRIRPADPLQLGH